MEDVLTKIRKNRPSSRLRYLWKNLHLQFGRYRWILLEVRILTLSVQNSWHFEMSTFCEGTDVDIADESSHLNPPPNHEAPYMTLSKRLRIWRGDLVELNFMKGLQVSDDRVNRRRATLPAFCLFRCVADDCPIPAMCVMTMFVPSSCDFRTNTDVVNTWDIILWMVSK